MWSQQLPGVSGGHSGMWPLGLEPVGGFLVATLMPGLNNTVEHVRYYGFYCWAHWEYEQWRNDRRLPYRKSEQSQRLERLEAALRAASLHADSGMTGVVGRNSYLPLPQDPDAPFAISESSAPTGFTPAQYSASWRNLQCGEFGQKGRVRLTDELGVPLARAFRSRLEKESRGDLLRLLSDEPTLPAGVIHRLGEGLRLRSVPPGDEEHELLTEMLFQPKDTTSTDPWSESHRSRRRSLGLILEFLRQGDGLSSPRDLHHVWATGAHPSGKPLSPGPRYENQFLLWQRYQERQCQKVAFYGILAAITSHLKRSGGFASTESILADVHRLAAHSEIAEEWFGASWMEAPLARIRERVSQRLVARGGNADLFLPELWGAVRNAAREAERVGAALALLTVTTATWVQRRASLAERQARWHAGRDFSRIPLDYFCEELTRHDAMVASDWLGWFVERFVLSQVVLVAMGKRDVDGNYRFFLAPDQDGFRIVKEPGENLYFDPPRVESALDLLEGLGYVRQGGSGVQITHLGTNLLERINDRAQSLGNPPR